MSRDVSEDQKEDAEEAMFPPTTVEAREVCYDLPSGGKRLVEGLSLRLEAATATALLGASGSSKTTTLRLLGRDGLSPTAGAVLVDGAVPKASYASMVPQFDALHLELTAFQSLLYAALLRRDDDDDDEGFSLLSWGRRPFRRRRRRPPRKSTTQRVKSLMRLLGVWHIRRQRLSRVSGGQLRRISAAVEFLGESKPLLLMDEVTSGLDAATAASLCETLVDAAKRQGRTVIASVHQPAWRLLRLFDSCAILASGGRLVFAGPPRTIVDCLARRGSPAPAHENPADWIIRVLCEPKVVQEWREAFVAEEKQKEESTERSPPTFPPTTTTTTTTTTTRRRRSGALPASRRRRRRSAVRSWLRQYRVLVRRTVHLWVVDPSQGKMSYGICVASAVYLGLLQWRAEWTVSLMNANLYHVVAIYFATVFPLGVIMPRERRIVEREVRNGAVVPSCYFWSRVTLGVLNGACAGLASVVVLYPMLYGLWPSYVVAAQWYLCVVAEYATVFVFAITLGVLVPSSLVALKTVPIFMLLWVYTSGFAVPQHRARPVLAGFKYPNAIGWATKVLAVLSFGRSQDPAARAILESNDFYSVDRGNLLGFFLAMALVFAGLLPIGFAATYLRLTESSSSSGVVVSSSERRTNDAAKNNNNARQKRAVAPFKRSGSSDVVHDLSAAAKKKKRTTVLSCCRCCDGVRSKNDSDDDSDDVEAQQKNGGTAFVLPTTKGAVAYEVEDLWYWWFASLEEKAATLKGIDVRFEAAKATAILGGSGSGKSTALKYICGRLRSSPRGTVSLDEKVASQADLARAATLTPQDDRLGPWAKLTVRQVLGFHARLRLPLAERRRAVRQVATQVGLLEVLDVALGSKQKPVLSGGELKRLSVATDLFARRPAFVVDECTTGLDAAVALAIVRLVADLTRSRRTVVATLHQPAWGVLSCFDHVVLLADGRVAYADVPEKLAGALASARVPCPGNENPADHAISVLREAAVVDRMIRRGGDEQGIYSVTSSESGKSDHLDVDDGRHHHDLLNPSSGGDVDLAAAAALNKKKKKRRSTTTTTLTSFEGPSWLGQTWAVARRSAYVFVVSPDQGLDLLVGNAAAALIIGLNWYDFGTNIYLGQALLFGTASLLMTSLAGTLLIVPMERPLVDREVGNGLYAPTAYWVARALVATVFVFAVGVVVTPIWCAMVGLPLQLNRLVPLVASNSLLASAFAVFAAFFGILVPDQVAASQCLEPTLALLLMTSGIFVAKDHMRAYMRWILLVNPINYATQNTLIFAFHQRQGDDDDARAILDYYDVDNGAHRRNFFILLAYLGAFFLIGALVARLRLRTTIDVPLTRSRRSRRQRREEKGNTWTSKAWR